MTAVPAAPFVVKDALVQFGTDSYEAAITTAKFTPNVSVQTATAMAPAATYTDQAAPTWTLQLEWLQDWATSGNLGKYLLDNVGEVVTCTFEPIAGGATVTADVVLSPGDIGGTAGSFATGAATMGVQGQPSVGA